MFPRICIQSSISAGKPTPVLWSDIEQAMRDPRIQDICDQIKLLDGNDPDELARLKRQLPIITPHACRFTGDGSRKSANAVPSGLVMLDIDHIDNPRDVFSTHIFPVLNNNNLNNINQQHSAGEQHTPAARSDVSNPVGCRSAAEIERELTSLILKAQQDHEEIILEITDYRVGTDYGYNHQCPPELQQHAIDACRAAQRYNKLCPTERHA